MIIYLFYFILIIFVILFEKSISNIFIKYIYESDLELLLTYSEDDDLQQFQYNRYKKSSRYLVFLVVLPLINFNIYFMFLIVFITVYAYKKPYLKLKSEFELNLSLVRYQFPIFLRQIQILLHSNNVLNALIEAYPYAPHIIKNDLKILIDSLSDDPNNIQAFISFMSHYKISEIDRAMKLLYRTYIVDKDESSKQLSRMINSTTKWIRYERKERNEGRIRSLEWFGIIPLFGVTIVFLVIMASLINNLFGKGGI